MKNVTILSCLVLLLFLLTGCQQNTEQSNLQVVDVSDPTKAYEPDRTSLQSIEKTMGISLSPHADYLIQATGSDISYYQLTNRSKAKTLLKMTDPYFWESAGFEWAGDGQQLLFTSASYLYDDWNNKKDTVWYVDLRNHVRVNQMEGKSIQSAQWSPDSRYILFRCLDGPSKIASNVAINLTPTTWLLYDTQTAKEIILFESSTRELFTEPLWFPDSMHLVYSVLGKNNDFILAVFDINQQQARTITRSEIPLCPLAWSPDGNSFFYETATPPWYSRTERQLGIYNLKTMQDRRLTTANENGPDNHFLSASPDGKILLFRSDLINKPKPELWQLNLETNTFHEVETSYGFSDFLWNTDSSSYYYFTCKNEANNRRGSIQQVNIREAKPKVLKSGVLQLQQLQNGKLYFTEIKSSGITREYTLKTLDLNNKKQQSIMRLPEYSDPRQEDAGQDFGFILRYGVGAKNELNTLKGTFTKDLISAGTSTGKLELSKDELQRIFDHMYAMKIADYPEQYQEASQMHVTPYITYDLTINYKGNSKHILWKDDSYSKSRQAAQLRGLFNQIITMIESKPEYKKMPPPVGGYD